MRRKILQVAALIGIARSTLAVTGGAAQTAPSRRPISTAPRARAAPSLAERLTSLMDQEPFNPALWGVAVADARGRVVFERNGDRLFEPASNTKLVVAAVATLLLPPTWRYRTSIYASGPVQGGVLRGDLVLYGRGDPTLDSAALGALADSLRARGVARVEGNLIGDASYFDVVPQHWSWENYDLNREDAAPVAALGYNANVVEIRPTPGLIGQPPSLGYEPEFGLAAILNRARTVPVDSPSTLDFFRVPGTDSVRAEGTLPVDARPRGVNFAVRDGASYAAEAFRRALAGRGIAVAGMARSAYDSMATATARQGAPLAEHLSPALPYILETILEQSQNWYAEMLLKTLGREFAGAGSWDSGVAVERRVLRDSMRVDSTMFDVVDGSGLSHHDLVAPRAFVKLLAFMRDHPRGRPFLDALPRAGREGTLRSRFRSGPAAGRVRAKTGSIGNVNTLSGYLDRADGTTWVFSIQINHHTALSREAIRRIDEVVGLLAR